MRPRNEVEVTANWLKLLRWLPLVFIGGALVVVYRRVFAQPAAIPLPVEIPALPIAIPVKRKRARRFLVRLLRWPLVLSVGAVSLMIASALNFPNAVHFYELEGPVLLMLLGGAALWAAMQLDWRWARIPPLPMPVASRLVAVHWSDMHVCLFLFGLIALIELIRINGIRFDTAVAISDSVDAQHLLLIAAVTLIIAGLGRLDVPRINWRVALPIVGITALGLAVRFWQIHSTPRFFLDDLFFSDFIRYIWDWRNVPLAAPWEGVAAEPVLFPYWQSLTVELFGRNFTGLRVASAIIGTLTIPAAYLLGRTLFDRKTALLGALLLATFPPHIHFSRMGLSEIAMALFGTASFAFFARGIMTNRRFDYVMGGAMLGMTHYFHEGGKYLFTPLAVIWLAGVWLLCAPRPSMRNLLLGALAAALVALPIYTTLLLTEKPLAARMVSNSAGLNMAYWQELFDTRDFRQHILQHLAPPFLLYVQRPDNTLFYAGGSPMLLPFVVPAFLLGFFYALRRWYKPGPMLLVGWVLAASLGNSLLVESANVARFVTVTPALMLLVAVGVRYTLPLFWPEQETDVGTRHVVSTPMRWLNPAYLQFALMGVLVAGIAAAQAHYYYNRHLPAYNEQFRNSWGHRDAQDAVLRSLDFPPGTQIHIISRDNVPDLSFTRGFLNFMVDDLRLLTLSADDFTPKYIALQKMIRDHAFYVDPYDADTIALIHEHFDVLLPRMSPFDLAADHQFVLYYAPAQPVGTR